jgi:predicted RNA-binding Zn ribbon-like protein
VKPASEPFSFHRGSPALDFIGTVGFRASAEPVERLPDAAAAARWFVAAGLAPEGSEMRVSRAGLSRTIALREALARAGNAIVDGAEPAAADVASVNAAAADLALGVPYLDAGGAQRWKTKHPLRFALARLAADAIAIFSAERARLTRCALDDCGALLLSRARNEPRRWCSMETCGNRAKVAAFRARKKRT